ncbi:hypothetical protein XENORESO_017557, partial [Xenotaenia resolanae]
FGPVYEADDPDQFMQHLESLVALGGGDEPEMCLSAVQLALTHSPPLSEIFVFTDASPKDAYLFDAVKALALEKRSKITFLLTEDQTQRSWRRKRSSKKPLSPNRFSLYSSLSVLSGGMAVFTTNSDIHKVSTIVEDNTSVDKVTLFHVKSDPELMSAHSFRVDSSVKNVILHITGTMTECILTSPSGASVFFPSSTVLKEHSLICSEYIPKPVYTEGAWPSSRVAAIPGFVSCQTLASCSGWSMESASQE